MNVLVIGATGGTGRNVVSEALKDGHVVTVLVRDPSRLTVGRDRVRVVSGSLPEAAPLTEAMRDQHAVVSALGVGKSFKPDGLIARSVPVILKTMTQEGVRRLIFMSAYGVGPTMRDVPTIPRIFMKTLLRDVYADKLAGDDLIRQSSLDWTLVHPTTLTNGPRTGSWKAGETLPLRGFPKIPRADVAAFLVKQLTDNTNLKKSVLVTS
jgi:putative NADH-flavin reductase